MVVLLAAIRVGVTLKQTIGMAQTDQAGFSIQGIEMTCLLRLGNPAEELGSR